MVIPSISTNRLPPSIRPTKNEIMYQEVQSSYGDIAKDIPHDSEKKIAMAFGYNAEDLCSLPEKANMGLSCGNPVAHANMKEVILRLMYATIETLKNF